MSAVAPLPLPEDKTALVGRLVEGLDAPALQWLSGYMAGAAALLHGSPGVAPAHPRAAPGERLTVLYSSQTGNARRLAEQLAARAEADGLQVRLLRTDAYPLRELKQERLLYVVASTQGEGEPADDARGWMEFLDGKRAPKLSELRFAVLALGDSSYPEFCAIGRRIDARLAELGGERLFPLGEADVDLDSVATPWLQQALEHAKNLAPAAAAAPVGVATVTPLRPRTPAWTRDRPFAAEVLRNQAIVARGSGKDVRHIELSLEDSGLAYEPGDSLGVWPSQAPQLVDEILQATGLDGDAEVAHGEHRLPLRTWLGERRELTVLTRPFLIAHAERGDHAELAALLQPGHRDALARLLDSEQLPDLLRRLPADWNATDLVAALRPLAPRLYSIASSRSEVEDEVHLTVAHPTWQRDDAARWGVAAHFLAAAGEGERVPVFIEANERFRLPADNGRDIVMIGPGTGVAPFRAFLQERRARGARGRNWLFFGNPHRRTDFLYQLEWQAALRDGSLDRLDVAFSRDQADKLYVQQRLREHGRELYARLDAGAYLYVCGDATHMARDVHAALLDIVAEHGGLDRDAAAERLDAWMAEGRYARDVY